MAKNSQKQPTDRDNAEREHQFRMQVLSTIQLLIAKGTPVAVTFFICAAVVLTARALAGKTTFADILFRMVADFHGLRGLAFVSAGGLAGGGVLYGRQQRKLRLDTDRRNAARRPTQMSFDPSKFLGKEDQL